MHTCLVIGLGKIGGQVANVLAQQGTQVVGVSRHYKPLVDGNVHQIQVDANHLNRDHLGDFADTIRDIVIIVAPNTPTQQGYQNSYFSISDNVVRLSQQLPQLKRVIFVSSTSVYGQNAGEIIDIDTPIQPPTHATAQVLLKTEQLLQNALPDKVTIVRASGIYGVDRLRFLQKARDIAEGEALPDNTWTNRIFDTDLVNVIVEILKQDKPLPVYLATDFAPVSLYEVLDYLATQQGYTKLLQTADNLALPKTGKRLISNLSASWLHYPNWQIGYQTIIEVKSRDAV